MDKREVIRSLDIKIYYESKIGNIKWGTNGQGKALCPFHRDRNPSLSIQKSTGLFYCHGCGESGDIFSFYMKHHKVDFKTALNELARMAEVMK